MEISNILDNLIGVYTPRINIDGTPLYGLASLDFPWLLRALLLVVTFYGITLILNTIIKGVGGRK